MSAIDIVVSDLARALGDRVDVTGAVREQHGHDEGWHPSSPPDAVVFAESRDDVVTVVRSCADHGVPIIPFGAGTSLEGHIAAQRGGITLDLSRMQRLLEVNVDDLDCRVEAGMGRKMLNERLGRDGLFFPVDPGADATIGGMTATGASGTNAVRYGTMRDNVLGLTVVRASGEVVQTGTRARKSSSGYDLTRLLVGSEGTLGVITEVALRLYGIPEVIGGASCGFAELSDAIRTVIETIQLGIPVARIELLDDVQVVACNSYSELDLPESPFLLLEFHGTEAAVEDQAEAVRQLATANKATGWTWSTDTSERNRIWQARHDAYYAALALRPGARAVATDVCVPISQLARCILETRADIDASGMLAPIVGHVGDGNFHAVILFDPDDTTELAQARSLNRRLVARAIAMGGTCTGEHGIGAGKIEFMYAEHATGVELMRVVKFALDPQGILNPGKVLPP